MEEKHLTGYPSIDKPWLKYYSEEVINAPLPECTMYEYVWENNKNHLGDVAIVYFGRKITYRKMFECIDEVASAFSAIGVKKGDIVTIQSCSFPQVIFIIYALSKLGAIANLIYVTSTINEVKQNLMETKSKIYISVDFIFERYNADFSNKYLEKIILLSVDDEMGMLAKTAYRIKQKKACLKNIGDVISWKRFLTFRTSAKIQTAGRGEDTVVIVYTGGTTGKSKGVMLSNRNLNVGALQYKCLGFKRTKVFLAVLPPFIAFGITVTIHMPLVFGVKMILGVSGNPSEMAELIEKNKPNYIICGTAQVEKMIDILGKRKVDLSSLVSLSVGGDVLSFRLEERVNTFLERCDSKARIAQGYAMSETSASATVSTCIANRVVYKKGAVGVPLVYTNIKIIDVDTGEELPYGKQGEICINSPCVMSGYYNAQEETDYILHRHKDGKSWVHTGDIGSMDEDGFLTIIGRIKRMILVSENSLFHKVFPKIIEDEILKSGLVDAVSVVGRESKEKTNDLVAFVTLKSKENGNKVLTQIKEYAEDNLEGYECPCEYIVLERLPLTTVGKVDYRALEEKAKK